MDEYLSGLTTEEINEKTLIMDECTTEQMLRLMNEQDAALERHEKYLKEDMGFLGHDYELESECQNKLIKVSAVLEKCRYHREEELQSNIRHFKPTFPRDKY